MPSGSTAPGASSVEKVAAEQGREQEAQTPPDDDTLLRASPGVETQAVLLVLGKAGDLLHHGPELVLGDLALRAAPVTGQVLERRAWPELAGAEELVVLVTAVRAFVDACLFLQELLCLGGRQLRALLLFGVRHGDARGRLVLAEVKLPRVPCTQGFPGSGAAENAGAAERLPAMAQARHHCQHQAAAKQDSSAAAVRPRRALCGRAAITQRGEGAAWQLL
eukprot:CAMPEP_0179148282 /NCGR_PEP_ID=MMETSP0796-20121207/71747_1 /TAXON_ID=73915 /ORGANISM="Pyrodinium bahamense, Strain pbaha01" /LENGTH=220 /DNA_ID=CAMNT_0020848983 /DNA_START=119 /DNA_END=782 /DNA_ORIENTATION=-